VRSVRDVAAALAQHVAQMFAQHLVVGRRAGAPAWPIWRGHRRGNGTAPIEAERGGGQERRITQEGRALDHVGQFPDIARPRMGAEAITRIRCQVEGGQTMVGPDAFEKQVIGSGPYKAKSGGWDRGMQTTMYCGNGPESWVRGNATLDTASGALSLTGPPKSGRSVLFHSK
jgi:hypothetical protein